jgi:methionine-rich copper-binding protein CopC
MINKRVRFSTESRKRPGPRLAVANPAPAAFLLHLFYLLALLILLLLLLLQAAFVGRVSAHALLVKSEPAIEAVLDDPPDQVVAWFSEELDSAFSTMRVFDEEGRQVDNGDGRVDLNDLEHKSMIVTLPASLPAGSFTVGWTVVSTEDGDPTEGEFIFGVGAGTVLGQPLSQPEASSSPSLWLLAGVAAALLAGAVVVALGRRRRAAQMEKQLASPS